ncbi:hypothetical protein MBLNU230_g6246t1 [Neophaeotheca triangularis]
MARIFLLIPRTKPREHQRGNLHSSEDQELLSGISYPDAASVIEADINDLTRQTHEGPWDGGPRQFQHACFNQWSTQALAGAPVSDPVPGQDYATTWSDGFSSYQEPIDPGFASLATIAGVVDQQAYSNDPNAPSVNRFDAQFQAYNFHSSQANEGLRSDGHLRLPIQPPIQNSKGKGKGRVLLCDWPNCEQQLKNISDARKHHLTHTKPFTCEIDGCSHRKEGFGTRNDLERHRNGVHGLLPRVGPKCGYVCSECSRARDDKADKWWPRKDNFKNHIKHKHLSRNLSDEQAKQTVEGIVKQSERPISHRPRDSHSEIMTVDGTDNSGYMSRQPSQIAHDEAERLYPLDSDLQNLDPMLPTIITHDRSRQDGYSLQFDAQGLQDLLPDLTLQPREGIPSIHGSTGNIRQKRGLASFREGPSQPNQQAGLNNEPQAKRQRLGTSQHNPTNTNTSRPRNPRNPTNPATATTNTTAPLPSRNPTRTPNGQYRCPHPGCKKLKPRECDLTKHQKRHSRPYGCTFPTCRKRFGSRGDWKRHESSQHQHRFGETWVCLLPSGGSGGGGGAAAATACWKLIATPGREGEEQMRAHVARDHGFVGCGAGADAAGYERLGAGAHGAFWCGFCRVVVRQESEVDFGTMGEGLGGAGLVGAWEARAKHVGDHFDRGGAGVGEWFCLEARGVKGESGGEGSVGGSLKGEGGAFEGEESDLGEDGIPGVGGRVVAGGGGVGDEAMSGFSDLDEFGTGGQWA